MNEEIAALERRLAASLEEIVGMAVRRALEDQALDQIVARLASRVGGYQIRVLIEKAGP